jgi:hypothetical protein
MNQHVFTATVNEESGIVLIRLNGDYNAKNIQALERPAMEAKTNRKK